MEWKRKAACAGRGDVDWDTFGPVQTLICADCPVRADCLHEGMSQPDASGCWGMTSERQRGHIRSGKWTVGEVWVKNLEDARAWQAEVAAGPTLVVEVP